MSAAKKQKVDPNVKGHVFTTTLEPSVFSTLGGDVSLCAYTHIGRRGNQEDRMVYCPDLLLGEYAFLGVFDGTVKEHASEWVHKHILSILLKCPAFVQFNKLTAEQRKQRSNQSKYLEKAFAEMYKETDAQLIAWCKEREIHYSACTSVTVLVHHPSNRMLVGHIGDSHAVLGTSSTGQPDAAKGKFLTIGHKADQPAERARIEANGGSVVYLHDCNMKPFIRGGDFFQRKKAMQLNYSRAFGGKDLKMYGLSAKPDLKWVDIGRSTSASSSSSSSSSQQLAPSSSAQGDDQKASGAAPSCVLLGSDGVWDVYHAEDAVRHCWAAQAKFDTENKNPCEAVCTVALERHVIAGSNDNVTLVALFF